MISSAALLTVFSIIIKISSLSACRISEFYCDNGECVGLDKFCDGNKDCQDGSDETRFCSRCNRTYYGDRHKTYQIAIARASLGRLPFVCALTFMAGGGDLGDIVELSFERFRVGRLLPTGCVDGFLQLLERNVQPASAGRWCGAAVSIPVYYSETNNVTLLLTVQAADAGFQFAVKFRYLAKAEAVTRYGPSHAQYHRGEWIPSSVCDRSFQDCDSQTCKLHSPNFPGVYPRNVTCLYHVTQRTIPRGKHAFVVLQQRHEDRVSVWVSSEGRGAYRREEKLLFGDACAHDYLRVYDGADAGAAVLATFCHGGALPPIVSSGPEMLVEFRASPSDLLELHTFELDVEVVFLPEGDVGLRASGHRCEWTIDAEERRTGVIHSLRHLAPPNTSCAYAFRGRPDDVVWLYFVKYFVDNRAGIEPADRKQPSVQGALYDGATANATRLAAFDDDTPVRLCVHARAFPNFIPLRPCRYPDESYLSSGPDLMLRYTFSPLFNLHYLRMEARYEFVDTYQEGEAATAALPKMADGACDRVFRSARRPEGVFTSPKNVFLFGRGGRRALRCSYTFVGRETETVRLVFRKVRLGNRKCDTLHDLHSRRYVCHLQGPEGVGGYRREEAELRVSQTLRGGVEVPMACLCRLDERLTLDLMASRATVNFSVTGMTSLEDFDSFYFEAAYEFLSGVHCNAGHVLDGGGGEIALVAGEADVGDGPARVKCPWLLPAAHDQFVHLRIPGVTLSELCETNNRVLVFAADELEPVAVVCPAVRGAESAAGGGGGPSPGEVEVYTKSWNKTVLPGRRHSNTLVVEFHAVEPGRFYFKWSRVAKTHVNKLLGRKSRSEECASKCTEPASCISALFWCDQQEQCGAEQEGDACTLGAHFPWLYVGIGIGCGVLVTMILVASLLHRRRETKAKKGKPVPTDEYPMDGKEVDC